EMAQFIAAAINANTDIVATAARGSNRVSLANTNDSQLSASSAGLQFDGNAGVAPGSTAVPFEETFTQDQMGAAIVAAVNANINLAVTASYLRGRINFLNAQNSDFSGTPAFQQVPGTGPGVTGTNVPVRLNVTMDETQVAQVIAAAVNAVPGMPVATAQGKLVQLADNNPLVQVVVGRGTSPFTIIQEFSPL